MSTDYQRAREDFGTCLRQLRRTTPAGKLTGTRLASLLGWPHSKVYKCEGGRQTITEEDLRRWVDACGRPEQFEQLAAQLRGFEVHVRSWRRQLAQGHSPVQTSWNAEVARSKAVFAWEEAVVPGMLQTADYARHIFSRYSAFFGSASDTDEAVGVRMQRQEWIYQNGHKLHALVWEAALRARVCPASVLDSQLDRLTGMVGMDSVELGVVPFTADLKLPTANGFTIFDSRLVSTEDWHAELWLDDEQNVGLYRKVWDTLHASAVFGAEAQRIVGSARRALASG